jgi:hypothetical protein
MSQTNNPANFSPYQRALKTSKVPSPALYSLRHTFLTRLGESGCDAWTLARECDGDGLPTTLLRYR